MKCRPVLVRKIHEAQFSTQLLDPIVEALLEFVDPAVFVHPDAVLFDPFGGIGHKLAQIAERVGMTPLAFEIEPGYFDAGATHPCVVRGDSTSLPIIDSTVSAAVTSPVYPNGMADNFRSRDFDQSVRHTYVHNLRAFHGPSYELQANNTAGVGHPRASKKALARMYEIHCQVWAEVHRVLIPGGVFVVNTKDTPKIPFTDDTTAQLREAGFEIVAQRIIGTPGHNHGENHENKKTYEVITIARKAA